jgi:hypothetical protein
MPDDDVSFEVFLKVKVPGKPDRRLYFDVKGSDVRYRFDPIFENVQVQRLEKLVANFIGDLAVVLHSVQ